MMGPAHLKEREKERFSVLLKSWRDTVLSHQKQYEKQGNHNKNPKFILGKILKSAQFGNMCNICDPEMT